MSMETTLLMSFFFFNDTATTEIYTLSLHDALPISQPPDLEGAGHGGRASGPHQNPGHSQAHAAGTGVSERRDSSLRKGRQGDRKSTRLNSSHGYISYAVFCLKKKKNNKSQAT